MDVTRKNKRYGRDSVDYERRWASALVVDCRQRWERTFRIEENYAFLTPVPRWREIFATCTSGRNADHEVCDILDPFIERELHPRTYNNRKGMGPQAAIHQVMEDIFEVTHGYTRAARVIKIDLKGFFPNADLDCMTKFFYDIIDKYREDITDRAIALGACPAEYAKEYADYLKWLVMVVVHCCPSNHCSLRTPRYLWQKHIEQEKSLFGKPEGIGAPIGRLPSQKGMGLYVNDEVAWLNNDCNVRTTCFMDDFVIVVPEERHAYALSLIPVLRKRFALKYVRINEKKFYDQPTLCGLEFLGSHIRNNRLHLNETTFRRGIARIEWFNAQSDNCSAVGKFLDTVNCYLGMLKTRTDYKRLKRMIAAIGIEWWRYYHYNPRRRCVVANREYTHNDTINKKYNLFTLKNIADYDTDRKANAA
jgi:hypothetical protein